MRFDTLLFDFDYTLADSSSGIVDCVNFALRGLGLPEADPGRIRRTIGLSMSETLRCLAGERQGGRADEFFRLFVERADQIMADRTIVFPEVRQVLPDLRRRGARLGIVSTKFRRRIQTILRREGLAELFDVVVGSEDVSLHKPDPGGLLSALETLRIPPEDALFVGDSAVDAETALRAGTSFAAVLTGVTPAETFSLYPACGLFVGLPALRAWLIG